MEKNTGIPVHRYYDGRKVRRLAPMAQKNEHRAVKGLRRTAAFMGFLSLVLLVAFVATAME